jgi:hypothetical protein
MPAFDPLQYGRLNFLVGRRSVLVVVCHECSPESFG